MLNHAHKLRITKDLKFFNNIVIQIIHQIISINQLQCKSQMEITLSSFLSKRAQDYIRGFILGKYLNNFTTTISLTVSIMNNNNLLTKFTKRRLLIKMLKP